LFVSRLAGFLVRYSVRQSGSSLHKLSKCVLPFNITTANVLSSFVGNISRLLQS